MGRLKTLSLVICFVIMLLFVGCADVVRYIPIGSSSDVVVCIIDDNGVSADGVVNVNNLHENSRAEMTYRIYNYATKPIIPSLYLIRDAKIEDYSKGDGYVNAPNYVFDWIDIPKMTEIAVYGVGDFTVSINMPEGEEKPADKIAFQLGVSGNIGGEIQTAVGTWWLVDFR